jgi:hypothetical protein
MIPCAGEHAIYKRRGEEEPMPGGLQVGRVFGLYVDVARSIPSMFALCWMSAAACIDLMALTSD